MKAKDALPLIDAMKFAVHWTGFQQRTNHANHVIGIAQLTDENGVFLPGLTLEIEVKAAVVAEVCLFQFSLRQKNGKERVLVYQLEVCPQLKRSHNGLIPIYGPHEHIGDNEPIAIQESSVNCDNWDGCLVWFSNRVHVHGLMVDKPC